MDLRSVLQGVVIIVIAGLLFYLAYDFYNNRALSTEEESAEKEAFEDFASLTQEESPASNDPKPVLDVTEAKPQPVASSKPKSNDCFPKDKLTPDDLLPKDAANSEWAQVNPAGQGDLKNKNYLTAGYHMGVNSIGSTLRNANMQIRSEPPNPQVKVSPWLQTTIDPDLNRRPMEINGCS
jgi:hypothetical protein